MDTNLEENSTPVGQVLFSADIQRSHSFYSHILGLNVSSDAGALTINILDHNLTVYPTSDMGLLADVGAVFEVSNIYEFYKNLYMRGITEISQLQPNPMGIMQFALIDPDRNALYFIEKIHRN